MLILILNQKLSQLKRSAAVRQIELPFQKKGIWVYDNGELVDGSPFPSLRLAGLAINSFNTNSVKVDSGILFKKNIFV